MEFKNITGYRSRKQDSQKVVNTLYNHHLFDAVSLQTPTQQVALCTFSAGLQSANKQKEEGL